MAACLSRIRSNVSIKAKTHESTCTAELSGRVGSCHFSAPPYYVSTYDEGLIYANIARTTTATVQKLASGILLTISQNFRSPPKLEKKLVVHTRLACLGLNGHVRHKNSLLSLTGHELD